MRLYLPFLLAQLSPLVLGERMESGMSEIDLVIPMQNISYELGPDNRFPLVWAVRNASIWTGNIKLSYALENFTHSFDNKRGEYSDAVLMAGDESDTRYISVDVLLAQQGDFQLIWNVHGSDLCEQERPGHRFNFSTGHGGRAIDLPSVASDTCIERSALAFNILNATDHECTSGQDDTYGVPTPRPCDFKLDSAAFPNITQSLNDQFNKTCTGDKPMNSLCPQAKKSSAVQLGMGIWLLSLPILAAFW